MNFIFIWLTQHWIEVTAAVFTLIFLYFEIRRKWAMWIVGILSGLFTVYINYDQQLYAMMGLRSYDVFVSIYGLYCWKFAKTKDNTELLFTFITKKLTLRLIVIGIVIFPLIGFIVLQFTDRKSPFAEGGEPLLFFIELLAATLSILAAWMGSKKIVEMWYLWMIVNPCTVWIYLYTKVYPLSIVYVIFAIFSIVGYIQWRKLPLKQNDSSITKS